MFYCTRILYTRQHDTCSIPNNINDHINDRHASGINVLVFSASRVLVIFIQLIPHVGLTSDAVEKAYTAFSFVKMKHPRAQLSNRIVRKLKSEGWYETQHVPGGPLIISDRYIYAVFISGSISTDGGLHILPFVKVSLDYPSAVWHHAGSSQDNGATRSVSAD